MDLSRLALPLRIRSPFLFSVDWLDIDLLFLGASPFHLKLLFIMRFTRAAILMTAFVLGVALFAHATPVPKVKTLSTGGKVSKSSSGKDPLFKTSKINTATTTKAKTAPVKSTKSKTAKASSKTTKAKATAKATNAKSDAALASKPECKTRDTITKLNVSVHSFIATTKATKATNANKPAKTNPACSLPGAHRRADCAAPPAIDCTSFDTCKSCGALVPLFDLSSIERHYHSVFGEQQAMCLRQTQKEMCCGVWYLKSCSGCINGHPM
jgi:hypothetical protein